MPTDQDKNNTKTHKELFTTHCDYHPELNEKLCLLYQGGFAIQQKASLFLEQLHGLESPRAYQARLKCAAYIPYLSEFITQFGSSLFSETMEVKTPSDKNDASTPGTAPQDEDAYKRFIDDCDLNGNSIHQFIKDVFEGSLHQLKVYVGLDFPQAQDVTSLPQEEEQISSQMYAYTIPYENIIDWKCDNNGNFIWLKTFEECFPNDDPLSPATHYYMFKIWRIVNGRATWQTWESATVSVEKKFSTATRYTSKESGITSFPQIPILSFCVPKGYHVGLQIGALCQEHYQRRSFMVANANKTCVGLGVITLGPEIGAPGDAIPLDIDIPQTPNALRSRLESDGWVVLRKTKDWSDSIEIVEAKGESHRFISDELKHLVESMMQTLRQMNMTASANQKAQGRSAASKQMDQHGTSMLLSVYERLVKDFVKKLFTCLSQGNKDDVKWTVEGLSIAEPVLERSALIAEVTQLGIDVMKLPDMFKNKYFYRLCTQLLDNDMSDREKMELQAKIEEMVKAGDFNALDVNEATAAGNKMAKNDGAQELPSAKTDPEGSKPLPDDSPSLGKSGNPQLPAGSHLQSGEHIEWQVPYKILSKDYKKSDLDTWVPLVSWTGPVEVSLSDINMTGQENWRANQPGPDGLDKVNDFAETMQDEGFAAFKPVILAYTPHNDEKYEIIDGRHRVKAAQKTNLPVVAYIAHVGSVDSDSPHMQLHSKQQRDTAVTSNASNNASDA